MKSLSVVLVVVALVGGCSKPEDGSSAGSGSGSAAAPAPPPTTPPPAPEPTPTPAPAPTGGSGSGSGSAAPAGEWEFDKLSYEEKRAFMKEKVVPTMKPLFQKFDAKEFASFGCKTCHGKDPQKTKYEMPSPDLAALDFTALEQGKQEPEMAKWMSEVVKPEMAKLLKEEEMTKSNPKGFGCLACHTEKK
ncbi:MAG: hypothetical protein H0T46_02755 [Deltaproteobacteria bacterium]|nr:hypothetical protein [Deltaproteobacteria bacterium]